MSKKSFVILVVFILAVFAAIGWFFIFKTPALQTGGESGQTNPFPFGNRPGNSTTTPSGETSSTSTIPTIDISGNDVLPRLRQVSFVPTAGAVAYDVEESVMIRFMERATGHVYETDSSKSAVTKISNVTIPKVHEAFWSPTGTKVMLRYLKDDNSTVRTFTARISASSSPDKAIEGSFLPDGIQSVAISGDRIFYLDENASGARGIRANADGSGKVAIFDSTFGDWTALWSSNDITIFPRPSAVAEGSVYSLDPKSGSLSKKIGGIAGLSALPNVDGSYILYSGKNGKGFQATIMNMKTRATLNASLSTLAEKCVWSKLEKETVYCAIPREVPSGEYPDDWYKGKIALSDSLWKISASTGETNEIMSPVLEGQNSMDMIDLGLDQKEKVLLFTDKGSMTVWRLNLEE